ncbi:hypothetical protein D9M68_734050 [compost metagenome]
MQRRGRVAGKTDACPVDPVQQVKADVGLPREVQCLVDQGTGIVESPAVHRDLGQPLHRKGLAGRAADGVVQAHTQRQMLFGRRQIAGQQLRLAPQRDAKSVPTCCADPSGFGSQPFCKGNDLGIGPRPVEESLQDAELPVEHAHGQVRQLARVLQVGPDALVQLPAGVRRRRLGPRGCHDGRDITGLQCQSPCLGRLARAHGRVGRAQGRGAAVGQRLAQPSVHTVRPHAHQLFERALGIALLDQRQGALRAQVV